MNRRHAAVLATVVAGVTTGCTPLTAVKWTDRDIHASIGTAVAVELVTEAGYPAWSGSEYVELRVIFTESKIAGRTMAVRCKQYGGRLDGTVCVDVRHPDTGRPRVQS